MPSVSQVTRPSPGFASRVGNERLPPLLTLSGIDLDIDHAPVLRGLDLVLAPGQALGVTGPNGSGKTTLLQLLATLRRPGSGAGCILGGDLADAVPAITRRAICLVGHEPALYPKLTLRENLRFVAALFGRPDRAVEEALTAVGLARAATRRVEQCSQGMARRVDLARALISEPRLLLLDEPHAGLDDAAGDLVSHLVRRVCDAGGGAVVVSHDRDRLGVLVDRVLELTGGWLVPAGSR